MERVLLALAVGLGLTGCRGTDAGGWRTYTPDGLAGVTALWAFAPDDVWAGSQTVVHFDGVTWTQVQTPSMGAVADFWGLAPDDLYAVAGQRLLRWDGALWSVVDFGGAITPADLQAVWGTSDADLWLGDRLNGQVFWWDGTAWSATTTQTVQVTDLWGAPGGVLFASGAYGLSSWTGSAWQRVSATAVAAGADGLWGFGAGDVWAAGDLGTLAHWDGTTWINTFPLDDPSFLPGALSAWGAAPDDVWAVGEEGTVSHWDGHGWAQALVGVFPYYPTLNKVHGSSADDVWAAGSSTDGHNRGVILHRAL